MLNIEAPTWSNGGSSAPSRQTFPFNGPTSIQGSSSPLHQAPAFCDALPHAQACSLQHSTAGHLQEGFKVQECTADRTLPAGALHTNAAYTPKLTEGGSAGSHRLSSERALSAPIPLSERGAAFHCHSHSHSAGAGAGAGGDAGLSGGFGGGSGSLLPMTQGPRRLTPSRSEEERRRWVRWVCTHAAVSY